MSDPPATVVDAISLYAYASNQGYNWRYGTGRMSADGRVWLTRFQKTEDVNCKEILYVGFDTDTQLIITEKP